MVLTFWAVMRMLIILMLSLLVAWPLLAQTEDLDRQINDQSRKLQQLRGEIEKLNKEIASKKQSERSTLKSLRQLEKQMATASEQLEFERAAELRDEITMLRGEKKKGNKQFRYTRRRR